MRLPISGVVFTLLAVPLILSGSRTHYMPDLAAQSHLIVGLILACPIFGIGYLACRFAKWHLRFHRRMKGPRR